jgi:hypothetical protein
VRRRQDQAPRILPSQEGRLLADSDRTKGCQRRGERFHPDEAGRERSLDDLSDGQRSLFHLAMTAATLDVEARIAADPAAVGFHAGGVPLPALTVIAVEEPENNLAPFYLSRRANREITGNFTKIGPLHEKLPDRTQQNQLVVGQFPTK